MSVGRIFIVSSNSTNVITASVKQSIFRYFAFNIQKKWPKHTFAIINPSARVRMWNWLNFLGVEIHLFCSCFIYNNIINELLQNVTSFRHPSCGKRITTLCNPPFQLPVYHIYFNRNFNCVFLMNKIRFAMNFHKITKNLNRKI